MEWVWFFAETTCIEMSTYQSLTQKKAKQRSCPYASLSVTNLKAISYHGKSRQQGWSSACCLQFCSGQIQPPPWQRLQCMLTSHFFYKWFCKPHRIICFHSNLILFEEKWSNKTYWYLSCESRYSLGARDWLTAVTSISQNSGAIVSRQLLWKLPFCASCDWVYLKSVWCTLKLKVGGGGAFGRGDWKNGDSISGRK